MSSIIFYLSIVIGILYTLVEEDIIPDTFGIFGYIDDILVILTIIFIILRVLIGFRESIMEG